MSVNGGSSLYDVGRIACDERGIVIRGYYLWGPKRIAYSTVKGVTDLPLVGLNAVRRWRIWGSGDFVHWNLDPRRPSKQMALVLDVGHRVKPTITPDDPDTVRRILREHLRSSAD